MSLRNFWIVADIEGRKTPLTAGGKSIDLTIKVNDGGESVDALHIECKVGADGRLIVQARVDQDFWYPGDGVASVEADKKHPRRHSAST